MRAAPDFCLVSMMVSVSSKAGVQVEWAAESGLPRQRLRGIWAPRRKVFWGSCGGVEVVFWGGEETSLTGKEAGSLGGQVGTYLEPWVAFEQGSDSTCMTFLELLRKTFLSVHTCAVNVRPTLRGSWASQPGGSSCTSKTIRAWLLLPQPQVLFSQELFPQIFCGQKESWFHLVFATAPCSVSSVSD